MKIRYATVRIDKLLANMGYGSRRDIAQMIDTGRIVLDEREADDAGVRIDMTPDLCSRMRVDGEALDPLPGMTLMLHKPVGMTCSHKDAGPLVYGILPPRWRRREPAISTVGRLDKESSGLLLLTDDGPLLHRIISPRNHVAKRYRVTLQKPLSGGEAVLFASGTLMLEGEYTPLLPVRMDVESPTKATVTLMEGRYHQVRRMFAAVDNCVIGLHRDRIGGLSLPADLNPGEFRMMTAAATAQIFNEQLPLE